jgi:hypothetical protein
VWAGPPGGVSGCGRRCRGDSRVAGAEEVDGDTEYGGLVPDGAA